MAYALHIERQTPIALDEWQSAVQQSTVARLEEAPLSAVNPATNEQVSLPAQPGAASVCVNGKWLPVFRWRRGKASFNAPSSTLKADPVMSAALALAAALNATVCGDEGETYDGSR